MNEPSKASPVVESAKITTQGTGNKKVVFKNIKDSRRQVL